MRRRERILIVPPCRLAFASERTTLTRVRAALAARSHPSGSEARGDSR